ncbi:nuclear transport factor 2 family protein [Novosphingobium flavum]|uniref:Nuclear transport factor 2 family protein n=1 Tax=Novosphingobium flavum TaxID=1778672 RepID=A0A7X1KMR7_9SPHN|nr:nuclear transport factor 2 family protein [Novosphingobium flavum]MBC2666643.1 nuclear transport factor 2 family protein [Novosphingobium flavum]
MTVNNNLNADIITLSSDDRLEIYELIAAKFFLCEDAGDHESWADLFTTDGTFFPIGKEPVQGRVALIEYSENRWEKRPEVRGWSHWVSNVVIRATAEGAESQSYMMAVEKKDGKFEIVLASAKRDEVRRENGKWLFHTRRTVPIGPA